MDIRSKYLLFFIPNLEGGKFNILLVYFPAFHIFPLIIPQEIHSWLFSLHRLPLLQTNLRDCAYVVYMKLMKQPKSPYNRTFFTTLCIKQLFKLQSVDIHCMGSVCCCNMEGKLVCTCRLCSANDDFYACLWENFRIFSG